MAVGMGTAFLSSLVKSATVNDRVDLKKVCEMLGVNITLSNTMSDLCVVNLGSDSKIQVKIKASLNKKEIHTLAVMATAESVINPKKMKGEGVVYDIFFLKDLTNQMHCRAFMLATRFAVPEHIIEQLVIATENDFSSSKNPNADPKFNSREYINNSTYMPEFLNMVIKESSAKLLLDNIEVSLIIRAA